jgi:hypothetical protein
MNIKMPKAAIDQTNRVVELQQEHPTIVGQTQRVLMPFAFAKQLLSKILSMEAQAEVMTGDPTAMPTTKSPIITGNDGRPT